MNSEICRECTRKCSQFMCCLCEHKDMCKCSQIEPKDDEKINIKEE